MSANYNDLSEEQVMQAALALDSAPRPMALHTYIESVRRYLDGSDAIPIPSSHLALNVGENHEGGHRLNVRIRQGAAWLGNATLRFAVTPGSSGFRDQSEQMEKFARAGEAVLARGRALHHWRQETARDMFECGVSVVQHHSRRNFYLKAQRDPSVMTKGARLTDIFWRRRVDPMSWYWDEDNDGGLGASMIRAKREVSEVAGAADGNRIDNMTRAFAWAESISESGFSTSNVSIETKELWFPDRGYLIYSGSETGRSRPTVAMDDPARIVASWVNHAGKPPFYIATASPWPWTSPLDEMIALTAERNYWATMHDYQAAGAIFRHWQLKDTTTGENIAAQLWSNPVPETVLLDLSKPPPNMGPGTEWVLAPFEFHDVVPRLQMIVQQHEAAGASIARLMGQVINANTAVGTADMLEDYARREMSDVISAMEDQTAAIWEDSFRYLKKMHSREPVFVAGRKRDLTSGSFFQTHLEIKGSDIVAEDVSCSYDTRSRLALLADYRYGREARTNGDMSFGRAVELGLVPYVDDAVEEKSDIFIDQLENITLETEAMAHQQAVAQSLGMGQPMESEAPAPPNITRGARTDPRGTGTGRGPDNISDTALAAGASDMQRTA